MAPPPPRPAGPLEGAPAPEACPSPAGRYPGARRRLPAPPPAPGLLHGHRLRLLGVQLRHPHLRRQQQREALLHPELLRDLRRAPGRGVLRHGERRRRLRDPDLRPPQLRQHLRRLPRPAREGRHPGLRPLRELRRLRHQRRRRHRPAGALHPHDHRRLRDGLRRGGLPHAPGVGPRRQHRLRQRRHGGRQAGALLRHVRRTPRHELWDPSGHHRRDVPRAGPPLPVAARPLRHGRHLRGHRQLGPHGGGQLELLGGLLGQLPRPLHRLGQGGLGVPGPRGDPRPHRQRGPRPRQHLGLGEAALGRQVPARRVLPVGEPPPLRVRRRPAGRGAPHHPHRRPEGHEPRRGPQARGRGRGRRPHPDGHQGEPGRRRRPLARLHGQDRLHRRHDAQHPRLLGGRHRDLGLEHPLGGLRYGGRRHAEAARPDVRQRRLRRRGRLRVQPRVRQHRHLDRPAGDQHDGHEHPRRRGPLPERLRGDGVHHRLLPLLHRLRVGHPRDPAPHPDGPRRNARLEPPPAGGPPALPARRRARHRPQDHREHRLRRLGSVRPLRRPLGPLLHRLQRHPPPSSTCRPTATSTRRPSSHPSHRLRPGSPTGPSARP